MIFIYDFLTDRRLSILRVWAAPGGRETFQKGGGKVYRPPGAAQTLKIDEFRSVKKSYIEKPKCGSLCVVGRLT